MYQVHVKLLIFLFYKIKAKNVVQRITNNLIILKDSMSIISHMADFYKYRN